MIKQGWARREKLQLHRLSIRGYKPGISEEMKLSVRVKQSFSCWTVDVNRVDFGNKRVLLRGFVEGERPSAKSAIDAFVLLWNKGLIPETYYQLSEEKRKSVNRMYSDTIRVFKTEESHNPILGTEQIVFTVKLNRDGSIPEYSYL